MNHKTSDFLTKEYFPQFKIEEKTYPSLGLVWIELQHASGFKILYLPKAHYREKYFSFFVPFGSMHAQSGVAHFLEHCVFDEESEEPFTAYLQDLGFQANAYTTLDYTLYFSKGIEWKKGDLEKAVLRYANQLWNPAWNPAKVEKERQIILSEWGMQQADKEYGFYHRLMQNLHQEHPFREEILGSKQDILNITQKDLEQFHQGAYAPNQMTLILVGDFDLVPLLNSLCPLLEKMPLASSLRKPYFDTRLSLEALAYTPLTFETLTQEEGQGMFYLAGKDLEYAQLYLHYLQGQATPKDLLRHKLAREECFEFFFGDQSFNLHQFYFENLINEQFYFVYNSGVGLAQYYFSCPHTEPKEALKRFQNYLKALPRESASEEKALFHLLRKARLGRLLQDTDHLEFMGDLLLQACIYQVDFKDYLDLLLDIQVDFEEFLTWLKPNILQSALVVTEEKKEACIIQ